MFFDALWTLAYNPIRDAFSGSSNWSSESVPPMSLPRKPWISSFAFTTRSTHSLPPEDYSTMPSTTSVPLFIPRPINHLEDSWDDLGEERKEYAGLRSRPLFDRASMADSPSPSPPPSPAISDTISADDDSEPPVPLHYPPYSASPSSIGQPAQSLFDAYTPLPISQDESPTTPSKSQNTLNRSPSLVPTIIEPRSPSPQPHRCVAQAEELGIKVRDFAFEDHGVPLARPVPDIEQLRARYLLYRTAGLTPPGDVLETLRDLDEEWLEENAKFLDERAKNIKPKTWTWTPGARMWRGFADEVPFPDTSEEPCTVEEIATEEGLDSHEGRAEASEDTLFDHDLFH